MSLGDEIRSGPSYPPIPKPVLAPPKEPRLAAKTFVVTTVQTLHYGRATSLQTFVAKRRVLPVATPREVPYTMPLPVQLRPCEKCQSLSRVVTTNYETLLKLIVRCKACGHVWVVTRSDDPTPKA